MKAFFITLFSIIVLALIAVALIWFNKTNIVNHYLAKDFGVPARIDDISLSTTNINIKNFYLGNPPKSKTSTALTTKEINVNFNYKELKQKQTIIDSIILNDIFLGVEFYNKDGSKNNWISIMADDNKKDKNDAEFLIKKIKLNNISVTLTQANGKAQSFSPIASLEFDNISNEGGLDQIEKAITNEILKKILQQYNLLDVIRSITPKLPIKIPFIGENKDQMHNGG